MSVRARLSAALLILFLVTLAISTIGLRMLRNAEFWLDKVHRETLTEVSLALDLSREAADLATAAPFLLTVQLPFQMQADAATIRARIATLDMLSDDDPDLVLPLLRLDDAIDDLIRVSSPQGSLLEEIARIDRNLVRLQNRFHRLANTDTLPLDQRLAWSHLLQLTAEALGVARAQEVIATGEFARRFDRLQQGLASPHPAEISAGLTEIDMVLRSQSDHLFVLKHRALTAALDAEKSLFRIRRLSNQINDYAAQKVSDAEHRLKVARAQTSENLNWASTAVFSLALASTAVALITAVYVSRYVAGNLRIITDAMRRLASGDRDARPTRASVSRDEIGQLFDAFEVFRENSRKLDRRTKQIARHNALFARVFRNINDGVAIATSAGHLEAENDKLRRLLRLPARMGIAPAETLQDLLNRSAFRLCHTPEGQPGFAEYRDADGNTLEIRKSDLPDGGAVWLLSETTERRRIDQRLEEIRKVETLGKVTGEVAHDFGNILSTIAGNLHLLETNGENRQDQLRRIRTAVDLGVSLTERLLAFARKQHLAPEVTDLNELVEGVSDLLSMVLPDTVTLSVDLSDGPLTALVDPGQLESALLNLCVNAGQAIDGPGEVTVATRLDKAGDITLSVQDTGRGMTVEQTRRAAEPFYSERPDGSGTGLGLSMVDGFVHQSGGTMTIASHLGKGTTVTLSLPPARPTPAENAAADPIGTAFVVDDNIATCESVVNMLRSMGYTCQSASHFDDAHDKLTVFSPDLLVTDLNLDHGKSGLDLISMVLQQDPTTRAVLMSTRLPESTGLAPELQSRVTLLPKPFTRLDMERAMTALNP